MNNNKAFKEEISNYQKQNSLKRKFPSLATYIARVLDFVNSWKPFLSLLEKVWSEFRLLKVGEYLAYVEYLEYQEPCVMTGGKMIQYSPLKKDRKTLFTPIFSYCPRYNFPFYGETQNVQVLSTFSPHQRNILNGGYTNIWTFYLSWISTISSSRN